MTTYDIIKKYYGIMRQFSSMNSHTAALRIVTDLPEGDEKEVAYQVYETYFYSDNKYPETAKIMYQIRASEG